MLFGAEGLATIGGRNAVLRHLSPRPETKVLGFFELELRD